MLNAFRHQRNGHLSVWTELIASFRSEEEVLQGTRMILDQIEVRKKEWTGGRRKQYSTVKTKVIAARVPVDLINEIHRFTGSDTYHLERALRLYVKVLGPSSWLNQAVVRFPFRWKTFQQTDTLSS